MITFKDIFDKLDGMRVIGLSELADKGLNKKEWYVIPYSLFPKVNIKIHTESDEANAFKALCEKFNDPTVYLKATREEMDNLAAMEDDNKLSFLDGGLIDIKVSRPGEDSIRKALWSMYLAFPDLPENLRIIKVAANYIAVDQGWAQLSRYDELRVIPDNTTAVSKEIVDSIFDAIDNHGQALITGMSLAAVSQWVTNHTLGGNASASLIVKALDIAGLTGVFKTGKLAQNVYTVFHQVNKRIVLSCITDTIRHLRTYYVYGCYIPRKYNVDNSIKVRLNSAPAGNKRIDLAIALVKYAVQNKFVSVSDNYVHIPELLDLKDRMEAIGTLGHTGAVYYCWKNYEVVDANYENLTNDHVLDIIRDYGSVMGAITKMHTVIQSPIVKAILSQGVNQDAIDKAKMILEVRSKKIKEALSEIIIEEEAKGIDSETIKNVYARFIKIDSPIVTGTKVADQSKGNKQQKDDVKV